MPAAWVLALHKPAGSLEYASHISDDRLCWTSDTLLGASHHKGWPYLSRQSYMAYVGASPRTGEPAAVCASRL